MQMPKRNKLLLLLFCQQAPIWREVFPDRKKISLEQVRDFGKVSTGTWYNWRKGKDVTVDVVEKCRSETFSSLKNLNNKFSDSDLEKLSRVFEEVFEAIFDDKKERVYATAKRIGFTIGEAQRIIDTHIFEQWPLFPNLYYPSKGVEAGEVSQEFVALGGAYYLWMRRGSAWLRCTLRVRYPLDVGEGAVIRCKLNVPIAHRREIDPKHWEYDGFVRVRRLRAFWMLEKRHVEGADYIYLITGSGIREGSELSFTGTYLTTGQDGFDSITVGDLLMWRLPIEGEEEMEKAMADGPQVLSGENREEPETRWRKLASRWAGPSPVNNLVATPTAL